MFGALHFLRNSSGCLPLDKARELFDTEKGVFSWMRGPGKYRGILIQLTLTVFTQSLSLLSLQSVMEQLPRSHQKSFQAHPKPHQAVL